MTIILPDDTDFELTYEKLMPIKKGMYKQKVHIQIPKFKIETDYELTKTLSQMGMQTAFSDFADFAGIGKYLKIGTVIHKAYVEVNEKGTEAAAVTVIAMELTSAGPTIETPTFKADHAFIFLIEDAEDNILFMGKMKNPAK